MNQSGPEEADGMGFVTDTLAAEPAVLPRWVRRSYRQIQLTLDASVLTFAFVAAYLLRFEFRVDGYLIASLAPQLPFVVLMQCVALFFVGAHRRVWRYTSLRDVPSFLKAAIYSTAVILAVRVAPFESLETLKVPLSIILMDGVFAFGGLLGIRALRRDLDDRLRRSRSLRHGALDSGERTPVLLVGAGRAGVLAIREVLERAGSDLLPVGFVDDDPLKAGSVIGGVSVLGTTDDIPTLVNDLDIDHVILTIADLSVADKRRIVQICESVPVRVREVPGYFEVLQGTISLSRFRDVDPEKLLGRSPVHLDEEHLRRYLAGRRVMVTGAGGSIGAELCRQVAGYTPECLVLVERAEHALFEIERELRRGFPGLQLVSVLADAGNADRMRRVLAETRPQLAVHAAAHKHVPMMERHPSEAIFNNILATKSLGELAGEAGVENFILVSTDKAVRPTSVMGASKRVAELVVQDLNARYPTVYAAVRFGNVLGSAGSVIPIFREQIRAGGPVTVTDPDMRRYFMSIPEASQLVLRAGSLAEGGEIFVLDMGQPVKILDLAEKMIRLSGHVPHEEIEIAITGRRRGEKLNEELGSMSEELTLTRHPKIFVGRLEPYPSDRLRRGIEKLRSICLQDDGDAVRGFLTTFLPESSLDFGDAPRETTATRVD